MTPAHVAAYALAHRDEITSALRTHAALSASALAIAAAIGVPLGVLCSQRAAGSAIVAAVTAVRVVPSLAVLTLVLPVLGLGFAPALVALSILAFPPILINTFVGYRDVDAGVREAAFAMGMTRGAIVRRIETPLAFPVVMTGMRTAAVEVIASATLATFIGGGGLGDLINNGLQLNDAAMLATGAALVALMALAAELSLGAIVRAARTPA
jgi:osmoprotectant transport system permease protein